MALDQFAFLREGRARPLVCYGRAGLRLRIISSLGMGGVVKCCW